MVFGNKKTSGLKQVACTMVAFSVLEISSKMIDVLIDIHKLKLYYC